MTQLSLTMEYVDLTPDEQVARGRRLAELLRQRRLMVEDHADRKKAMKEELEALDALQVADVVRLGKEERPVGRERG